MAVNMPTRASSGDNADTNSFMLNIPAAGQWNLKKSGMLSISVKQPKTAERTCMISVVISMSSLFSFIKSARVEAGDRVLFFSINHHRLRHLHLHGCRSIKVVLQAAVVNDGSQSI